MSAGSTHLKKAKALIAIQGRSKDALALLEKAAALDNAEALYAIGTWHLFGVVVKKNFRAAVDLLKRAADLDHADAASDLAICYEKGKGVAKDTAAAFRSYMKAALLGDQQAKYDVGRCFYWGIGTKKDRAAAEVWFIDHKRSAPPAKMAASARRLVRKARARG